MARLFGEGAGGDVHSHRAFIHFSRECQFQDAFLSFERQKDVTNTSLPYSDFSRFDCTLQFQGGQRALARAQARSGVQGAAGAAQFRDLNRDRLGATQGMERDILLENINVQDRRRQALSDLIQQQEGREFSQQNTALQGLQGLTAAARNDELEREQFNIGQQANLVAGQQALYFGGMGIAGAKRNALANARAEQQQEAAAIANANAAAAAAATAAQQQQTLLQGLNLPNLF